MMREFDLVELAYERLLKKCERRIRAREARFRLVAFRIDKRLAKDILKEMERRGYIDKQKGVVFIY